MSAPFLTFADVKDSRVLEIAGVTAASDKFRKLVNEAGTMMAQCGDWPGTLAHIQVCVKNGCVTWPRSVQVVRRMNRCGQKVTQGTIWWDFINRDQYENWSGYNYNMGAAGSVGGSYGPRGQAIGLGRACTYNDIPNGNWLIRAYAFTPQDYGKTITIFGLDVNGKPLIHRDANGNWQDGLLMTLRSDFAVTMIYVRQIDRVVKDCTQQKVALYASNADGTQLWDLAVYEPGETNPSYERQRVETGCLPLGCGAKPNDPFSIVALVKLAFVPVKCDNDLVLIPSLLAIKYAVQSLLWGDKGDSNQAAVFKQMAIAELNSLIDDILPRDQTPVDSGFGGGDSVGLQRVL